MKFSNPLILVCLVALITLASCQASFSMFKGKGQLTNYDVCILLCRHKRYNLIQKERSILKNIYKISLTRSDHFFNTSHSLKMSQWVIQFPLFLSKDKFLDSKGRLKKTKWNSTKERILHRTLILCRLFFSILRLRKKKYPALNILNMIT